MIEPQLVEDTIRAGLPEATVKVLDPQNDKTHLQAIVISENFAGKTRIARHRMVYAALGNAFSENLHALALATKTPQEWASEQENKTERS